MIFTFIYFTFICITLLTYIIVVDGGLVHSHAAAAVIHVFLVAAVDVIALRPVHEQRPVLFLRLEFCVHHSHRQIGGSAQKSP